MTILPKNRLPPAVHGGSGAASHAHQHQHQQQDQVVDPGGVHDHNRVHVEEGEQEPAVRVGVGVGEQDLNLDLELGHSHSHGEGARGLQESDPHQASRQSQPIHHQSRIPSSLRNTSSLISNQARVKSMTVASLKELHKITATF